MENNFFIWAMAAIIFYFIFKSLLLLNRRSSLIKKEMDEIINSDKYKVKGQYEN